jgi:hypothetical protein
VDWRRLVALLVRRLAALLRLALSTKKTVSL